MSSGIVEGAGHVLTDAITALNAALDSVAEAEL
jgi:hypothetical protein